MIKILDEFKNKQVVLWGADFLGQCVAQYLVKQGVYISSYWDKKFESLIEVNSLPVYKPLEGYNDSQYLILICIGNCVIRKSLRDMLEKQCYYNVVPEFETKEIFNLSISLEKNTSLGRETFTKTKRKKLQSAFEYAIQSDYEMWRRQHMLREKIRLVDHLVFMGVDALEAECDFYTNYCINNGLTNLSYVCDAHAQYKGKHFFRDLECIMPEDLCELEDFFVVLIEEGDSASRRKLQQLGVTQFCTINDLELCVYDDFLSKDWFTKEQENMLKAYDLLEDEESKEVYVEAICNRIAPHFATKDYMELMSNQIQYYDYEIIELSEEEYCIDAGAYTGDSLEAFIKQTKGKFGAVYAFELDNTNYNELLNIANRYNMGNIYVYNKGVYCEKKDIMYSGTALGGNVMQNGEQTGRAELVSLDNELADKKVTFIKMDIEGCEMDALYGAKNIISMQRPKLVISTYHHLSDMWNVPLYLKSLHPDYKIQYRHYTDKVWDTDCYIY